MIIVTVIIMMIIVMMMIVMMMIIMMMMMLIIMIMLIIVIIIMRSPPAPVEPWLRETLLPAGKQTGPAAVAANIQYLGIFHFLKVFCICQTFNILHFFIFYNNDNNGKNT